MPRLIPRFSQPLSGRMRGRALRQAEGTAYVPAVGDKVLVGPTQVLQSTPILSPFDCWLSFCSVAAGSR
eukprot:11382435-Alexandrium_andersonii.AAC.1